MVTNMIILTLLLGEDTRWDSKVGFLEDLQASDLDLGRKLSRSPFLLGGGVRGVSLLGGEFW